MDIYPLHPVTDILPAMPEADFQDLKADIKMFGLREPLWLYKGRIIDGRHRYRALRELWDEGQAVVEIPVRRWEGTGSLVDFVMSLNCFRRHLNESQRAIAAARAREFYGREGGCGTVRKQTERAAESFSVGRATIEQAAAVLKEAAPELVKAVERGDAKINQAFHMLDLPKEEQAVIAQSGEKEIKKAANEAKWRKRIGGLVDSGTPEMEFDGARFSVVLADPPWRYEHEAPTKFAPEYHYPTMDLDDICKLPVQQFLTEDAMLYLWATAPKIEEALRVLNSWGFSYRSQAIWVKPSIGPGYYFRIQHEVVLIGSRGKPICPLPEARVSSIIQAPRREHSRKPDEIYDILDLYYEGLNKIELFAREARPGWVVWGFETDKFNKVS